MADDKSSTKHKKPFKVMKMLSIKNMLIGPDTENSTKSSSMILKDSLHRPSNRSRKSVLQGSSGFVWNRDKTRKTQPYTNHKYDIPFNPPPNEINFMGGLGIKRGNPRSKIHPNRSTTVQKLLNMRTSNRILPTFGESLEEANCWVHEKKSKPPTDIQNDLTKILTSVKVADNYDTPSGSNVSSPRVLNFKFSTRVQKYRKLISQKDHEKIRAHQNEQDYIYYYDKNEIKDLSTRIIETEMKGMLRKYEKDDDEQPFREWAMEQRAKYKASLKPVDEENLIINRILPLDFDRKVSIVGQDDWKVDRSKLDQGKPIKKLGGYLYGPFTQVPSPDPFTKDESKFAIPKTMMDRYEKEFRKHKIRKRAIRRARLFAMGLPMPPSSEYSTDEEMEEVKTLALIRTPYFIIPTVRTQKKKKADRFKNKFLRRDGLRRITMLLYDRTLAKRQTKQEKALERLKDPFKLDGKFRMKKIITKVRQALVFRPTPVKEKYLKFIEEQYKKQKKIYSARFETAKKCITFDEFKELEMKKTSTDTCEEKDVKVVKTSPDTKLELSSMPVGERYRPGINTTLANQHRLQSNEEIRKIEKPKRIFQRFKMHRSSRIDDLIGPFYTDPFLMDKFREPSKFEKESKYYTSCIRGRFGIRNRLQVNTPKFDDEKLGETEKYFHRLGTEWDSYYVNELRHRPPVKKYCVKSNIIFFRETTRKRYIQYYIQENLLNLVAKLKVEERYLNDFEQFINDCKQLFSKRKSESYQRAMSKIDEVNPLVLETRTLEMERNLLKSQFDNLQERLIKINDTVIERMKMQNYYFLLMDTQWRQKYDFIHRKKDGSLKTPIEVQADKSLVHILPEVNGFEIKKHYDEKILPILDHICPIEPDPNLVRNGFLSLKLKAFTYATHHNTTLWFYETIVYHHGDLHTTFQRYFDQKQKLVEFQEKKLRFIEERNYVLSFDSKLITRSPLYKCVKNPDIRKITAICDQLYLHITPVIEQDEQIRKSLTVVDKFIKIQENVMDLLEQMDKLPVDVLKRVEKQTRKTRRRQLEEAQKAMVTQNRFNILRKQLKFHFNMGPPRKVKIITHTVDRTAT